MPITRQEYLEALHRIASRVKREASLRHAGRPMQFTSEEQREHEADLAIMGSYVEERAADKTNPPVRSSAPGPQSGEQRVAAVLGKLVVRKDAG